MIRLLILLLGSFGSRRLAAAEPAWAGPDAAAWAGADTARGWAPLNAAAVRDGGPAAVRDGGPAAPAEVPPQPRPGPVAGQPRRLGAAEARRAARILRTAGADGGFRGGSSGAPPRRSWR